jgi:ketosteroid isomerase-like protein
VSQENVDLVLRAIEAFTRGDLPAIYRESTPDVEVDWSRSAGLEAGVYRGQAATGRFWGTFFDAFDRIDVVPEEVIAHGDCVVVFDRTRLTGRDGIEVETHNASVATIRDGRIARWVMYRVRAEALNAVGLI